ncbi:hypothetical protein [Bacillus massiliigorillae]|uniref:hypothetical protein n=1 Tax=Bacillus massiliigorillae TaxID=1243664 RepID=UPI0003A47643|nr:hypothetical protein [Bacillus massiliigorillae]
MIVIEKLDDYNEELLEQMRLEIERYINDNFAKSLNLTRLDCLYFPNDFDKAILDFQIAHGLEERGYTNNEMGTAFGKTMQLMVDGDEKDRIFIRKEILIALFLGDDEGKQLSLNLIHHELCHVHENHDLASMTGFQKEMEEDNEGLNHVLNLHAMNIFSEYVVPKMAVTTKAIQKIVNVDFLIEIIEYTKNNMDNQIQKFEDGEIEILAVFGSVQLTGGHLMKVLATLIGELEGLNKNFSEVEEQIDLFMDQYYIGEIWSELKNALRTLDSTYPNWDSLNVLEPLKEVILKMWNCLRVYPTRDEINILI